VDFFLSRTNISEADVIIFGAISMPTILVSHFAPSSPHILSFQCHNNQTTMGKTSKKTRLMGELRSLLERRLFAKALRQMQDDDDSVEDRKDLSLLLVTTKVNEQHYLFRTSKYRKGATVFNSTTTTRNGPWWSKCDPVV
jgi:hypothetical protein